MDKFEAIRAMSHFTKVKLSDFYMTKKEWEMRNSNNRKIFKLADTTTSTSGIATSTPSTKGVQGILWFKEIIQYAEDLRRFDQAVMHNEYMVNTGAHEVMIPRTTSHLTINTSTSEGADRTFTALNNISTVAVTLSASDFKKGGIAISKEAAKTSMVDLVAQARYAITQAMARDLDVAIATELQDTSVTNRVYGGDATDPSELTSGDILTPDLVAEAMYKLEQNNFVPKLLYISPAQLKAFRKDSQFVNAAEYGSNDVILKGEVGQYLGVKIIVTTNVPAYSQGQTDTNENTKTWGAAGHCCIMVGTNHLDQLVAGVVAWKEKPTVDYEYNKLQAEHRIYYDQAFKVKILEPKAVCLIKVTDS